jgi:hypothetical protein
LADHKETTVQKIVKFSPIIEEGARGASRLGYYKFLPLQPLFFYQSYRTIVDQPLGGRPKLFRIRTVLGTHNPWVAGSSPAAATD